MPSLSELQEAFAAAVFDRGDTRVLAWIHAGDMSEARRIEVYRNNVRYNYREALRDVYPVVERLVGTDFFGYAANAYVVRHRSRQGNLHAYGDRFPGFLKRLPDAAGLPYLPAVARLEWLVHEAFHAADARGLTFAQLAALAPGHEHELAGVLHPSCRLMSAPWPVHRIWQANQPDGDGVADLSAGPVRLLIRRDAGTVTLEPLSRGAFALLTQCARRRPLTQALAAAQAAEPGFDFGAFLARRLGDGSLVELRVTKT